jgi:hypothetical protein
MADKYFSVKPCKRGHISARLVSSGACCECQSEKNRARYAENTEKIQSQVYAYRANNPEKVKAGLAAYKVAYADVIKERDRARNIGNRKASSIARLNAWNKANPEKTKARVKAWMQANPDKGCAKATRYRAAKLNATPSWADHVAIGMIYRAAEVIRTTGFDVHVDHVVPLQGKRVTGLHVHNNLRVIQANANRSKSNHF